MKCGALLVIGLLSWGATEAVGQIIIEPENYRLTGPKQKFEWADIGSEYRFRLGTIPENYTSGDLFDKNVGAQTSVVVSGLPVDGSDIYGRLDYFADGTWKAYNFTFFAADWNCFFICTSSVPSSSSVGAAVLFEGLAQAFECVSEPTFSWQFGDGSTSSKQRPTHAYGSAGSYSWVYEVSLDGDVCRRQGEIEIESVVVPAPAQIVTPRPGSVLSGTSETFEWTPGVSVTGYRLRIGSSLGGQDIFSETLGSQTWVVVTGLPTDGRTIYARLESRISGSWKEVTAQYQAVQTAVGVPTIEAGGIVTANLLPTVKAVSPLGIFSVFGHDFSDQTVLNAELDENGELARILGGTCLEMNGERLSLFAVTPNQINAQAPAAQALGPASFRVVRNCDAAVSETSRRELSPRPQAATSQVEIATVENAAPVFFLYPPLAEDGLIAARFNADNVAVAPAGMLVDQFGPSRPATAGDIIVLYGTGWGETTADLDAGELASGAAELQTAAHPMVSFGGIFLAPEDVLYAGITPQAAGLYQLAIRVPANAQPGNNQVTLTVYGKSTPVGPVVPVASP